MRRSKDDFEGLFLAEAPSAPAHAPVLRRHGRQRGAAGGCELAIAALAQALLDLRGVCVGVEDKSAVGELVVGGGPSQDGSDLVNTGRSDDARYRRLALVVPPRALEEIDRFGRLGGVSRTLEGLELLEHLLRGHLLGLEALDEFFAFL